jgi:hypothetical protein
MMKEGQAQLQDAEGMEGADNRPQCQRQADSGPDREVGLQQQRHHGTRQTDHRTDRQVDAAGDDDEGLADRNDRPERRLTQQIDDVVGGHETVRRDGQHQPHQQKQPQQRQVEEEREAETPPRLGRDCQVSHLDRFSPVFFLVDVRLLSIQVPIASARMVS